MREQGAGRWGTIGSTEFQPNRQDFSKMNSIFKTSGCANALLILQPKFAENRVVVGKEKVFEHAIVFDFPVVRVENIV